MKEKIRTACLALIFLGIGFYFFSDNPKPTMYIAHFGFLLYIQTIYLKTKQTKSPSILAEKIKYKTINKTRSIFKSLESTLGPNEENKQLYAEALKEIEKRKKKKE